MNKRNTVQKSIILQAVKKLQKHVTADEVYNYIHSEYKNIGKGTVYRNLNILAEEGEIRKIEVSDGADHYDFTCKEHYHMQCMECGKIFDVDMDAVSDMMSKIKDNHGMKIMSFDILFKGLCAECQKAFSN